MIQLVAWAGHEFRLGKRGKDGQSLRETLEVVAKMKGVMPEEGINPEEFSGVLYELWTRFLEMNAKRRSGLNGPDPITHLDLQAYCWLHRMRFEGWELATIHQLDALALESIAGGED